MSASSLILASLALMGSAAAQLLSPANSINLPASKSASQPLEWLGGNSPYFAGEDFPPDSLIPTSQTPNTHSQAPTSTKSPTMSHQIAT